MWGIRWTKSNKCFVSTWNANKISNKQTGGRNLTISANVQQDIMRKVLFLLYIEECTEFIMKFVHPVTTIIPLNLLDPNICTLKLNKSLKLVKFRELSRQTLTTNIHFPIFRSSYHNIGYFRYLHSVRGLWLSLERTFVVVRILLLE